uniref:Endo-beta-1,4-glucanase n=1 Tax=Orciraptor agilis TaxID=1435005 RepID=A0A9E9NJ86_9EUKA|nr:endo-beta-1,4-glucanase [Orciraptor agilis]
MISIVLYLSLLVSLSILSFAFGAHLKYTGVTESGLEFGYSVAGVGSGPGVCQPTAASYSFMVANKLNHVRVAFRWERIQPQLNGPLDPTELGKVTSAVSTAFASGLQYVLVDVHNYADYAGTPIGQGAVTIAAFANLWSRLAVVFTQSNIVLGLMNEPVGPQSAGQGGGTMTTETWLAAVNAAIAAIRAQGNTNLITVPGLGYTGAHVWASNPAYYGTSNSLVMQNVVDPLNNYVYEIHQYLDSSTGFAGTATDCVDGPTIISQFTGVIQWATMFNKKLWLGEFAAANSPVCQSSITALLNFLEANSNIFVGWTWWSAGPCWGNYMFSLEPGTANPQINWISPFGALNTGATSAPTTLAPTTATTAKVTATTVTTAPTTAPTTATKPALTLVTPPASVSNTGSFSVTAQYTTAVPSEIVINLLELPTYTFFGGSAVAVAAGSGTVTLSIVISPNAPTVAQYTLDAFLVSQTAYAGGTNAQAYLAAFVDVKSPIKLIAPTTAPTPSVAPTTPAPTTPAPTKFVVPVSGSNTWVLTLAADPNQNGGKGINNLQCNQGVLFATVNLLATVTINNIFPYQPMQETGLPTIAATFTNNGQPAKVVIQNVFSVAASTVNGGVWTFGLQDDGPNLGAQLSLGPCTAGTIPTVTVSFAITSNPINVIGLPTGADGHPPIPAIAAVNGVVVNNLPPQFVNGAAVPPSAAPITAAPTTIAPSTVLPTTVAAAAPSGGRATGVIIVSVSANANAPFTPQCSNGKWALFGQSFILAVTVQLFGSTKVFTNQPMAETVQDTVTGNFLVVNSNWFINGVAAPVTVTGTFNVGSSTTNANTWSFALMDDQPNIGGSIFLGAANTCTQQSAVPTIEVNFGTNQFINAMGNIVSGQGQIPAVSAIPSIANNLSPINRMPASSAGAAAPPSTSTTAAPVVTSVAPLVTTTTAAAVVATTQQVLAPTSTGGGVSNGKIVVTVSASAPFAPQCSNGQWALFGQGFTLSVSVSLNGGAVFTQLPMAETIQDSATGNFLVINSGWLLNGAPVPVTLSSTFNVGSSVTNANVWSFALKDDQPNIGGTVLLTPPTPCTFNTAAPLITVNFNTNQFINGVGTIAEGQGNIPAVSALPTIVNALNIQNIDMGQGPTLPPAVTTTVAPAASTTTAGGATTTTTAAAGVTTITTTAAAVNNIETGMITIAISSFSPLTPQCSNGQWALFGTGFAVTVTVQKTGGQPVTNQPMAETIQDTVTGQFLVINSNWFLNGVATPVTVSSSFNVGNSATSGSTWSFALQDDQGSIGGTLLLGPANSCSFNPPTPPPTVTVNFNTNTFIHAAGTGAIPAVNALPTIVNNLLPTNVQPLGTSTTVTTTAPVATTTAAAVITTTAAAGVTTTAAAGVTTTKAAVTVPATNAAAVTTTAQTVGVTNGLIEVSISTNAPFLPQCNNGVWSLFGQGFSVAVTVQLTGGQPFTQLPMAETIQDSVTQKFLAINSNWFLNGAAAPVTVQGTFNVGSPTTSGNTFTFSLQDDQPSIGGTISLTPTTPCTFASTAPAITVNFNTNQFINGVGTIAEGQGKIPAVSALPTIINGVAAINQQPGSGTAPIAKPTNPPTQTPPTQRALGVANGAIVVSISSSNAFAPQCSNGQWALFGVTLNLAVTVQLFGGKPFTQQPMAETVQDSVTMTFLTVNMNWFLNGAAAPVTTNGLFNIATSSASGNTFSFALADDQPNVGGTFLLGAAGSCTQQSAAPTVTANFNTNQFINGVGTIAEGQGNIPAVSALPTIINALNPANVAPASAAGAVATTAPTAPTQVAVATTAAVAVTTTAPPPTVPPPTNAAGTSYVIRFAADPTQNGGQGINGLQCAQGTLQATVNLLVSVDINNIFAYQPMAELGLALINAAFTVGGAPGAVNVQNSFNVASSATSGNVWTFGLQDDGPHPGAQLTLGTCTGNTVPAVTVSFSTISVLTTAGLPNGADGGPAVPAVTNAVPTIVNALPAQFNGGATGSTGSGAVPAPTTPAPTAAVTTMPALIGAGAPIQQTITTNIQTSGYCTGNQFTVPFDLTILTAGQQPMAETGLATVVASVTYNQQPVMIVSLSAYNMQPTLNGNTFTFAEMDDQPNVGGQLTLNIPCSYTNAPGVPRTNGIAISYAAYPANIQGQSFPVQINNAPVSALSANIPPVAALIVSNQPVGAAVTPNQPAAGGGNNNNNNNNVATSSSMALSTGAIIGIVVAIVAVVALVAIAAVVLTKRSAAKSATNENNIAMANSA